MSGMETDVHANKKHNYTVVIAAALFIVGWIVLLLFVSPEDIVASIGVHNAYLVSFIVAVAAGVSSFTSTSFYTLIATFAAGGASPLLLGLAGGIGLFISNAIFYALFFHGKHLLSENLRRRTDAFAARIQRYPSWIVLLVVYLYSGFTPFPDDVLMAALALTSYTFVRFGPVLFLGNLTLITLIGVLAQYGLGSI